MTTCTRCNRPLKLPTETGMGPRCSKLAKAQPLVERGRELWGYDLDRAVSIALERVQVTVAASAADAHMAVRRKFHAARVLLLGWAP